MIADNPKLDVLSETDRQIVESWLVSFDKSWSGTRLADQVRELPPPGSPLRLPALLEMVKIDMERQWQEGQRPTVDSYLAAYPELGRPDDAPVDLLHAEYEVRRQFEPATSIDDFAKRFPSQASALRRLAGEIANATFDSSDPQANLNTIKTTAPSTVRDFQPSEAPKNLTENFGRYQILKILGKGGMGSVYLAHDRQLDRDVALKVPFFRSDDDPGILRRFYREAQAAAALHHPNICAVHDVGEIDGIHFLTMAYIRGQSLAEVAKLQQPFPQERAAGIVRKVALALEQAHRHGVIHRDLKPSNIMLEQSGEPIIMDFGLARRLDNEDARLTKSGDILGTPAYMSPEQVAGDNETIGRPTDVYSLGVILYELLTGRIPFQGSLTSIIAKIATDVPAAPSTVRPGLDPRLDTICLKAMAKNPADRFSSMEDFAGALAGVLNIPTLPAPAAKKTPQRRRWPIAAAFAAVALLLGTVIYVSTDHGTVKFESGTDTSKPAGAKPMASSGDEKKGKMLIVGFPNGPAGEGKAPSVANTGPKKSPELERKPGKVVVCEGHSDAVTSVAFSVDNGRVVSGAKDKTIRLWDGATGKELNDSRVTFDDRYVEDITLSPDGRLFLHKRIYAVVLGDVTTQMSLKQVEMRPSPSNAMAFARNGRRVIVGVGQKFADRPFVWVWDLETEKQFEFRNHAKLDNHWAVALSADGKLGASLGRDGVRLWEVETGQERWNMERPSVTALTFSPDGKFLVSGAMLGTLLLHEADTGKEIGRFEGHTNTITSIAFSADGNRLLSGSVDKTVRQWDVANRKELARDDGHTDAVQCVALSTDGRAASGSKNGTVRLWSTAGNE